MNQFKLKQKLSMKDAGLALVIGLTSGTFIYFFKVIASFVVKLNWRIFTHINTHLYTLPLIIVGLFVITYLIDLLLYIEPNAGGSSISRVKKLFSEQKEIRYIQTILLVSVSTLMMFLTGMPLGIEGPSVMIGSGFSYGFSRKSSDDALSKVGAAAGFSAVTGSFLSAVLFAAEEVFHEYKKKFLLLALIASSSSYLVLKGFDYLFNMDTSRFFHFYELAAIPLTYLPLFVVIGLVSGVCAALFNKLIYMANWVFKTYLSSMSRVVRFFLVLLIVLLMGLIYQDLLGSGHDSILAHVFHHDYQTGYVMILLGLKVLLIALSNAADLPGGMFVPVLVVGALFGALFNQYLIHLGLNQAYTSTIVLTFMAGFFTTSMSAPLSGVLFFIEASFFHPSSFYVIPSVVFSYSVCYALRVVSINDIVIESNIEMKLRDNIRYQIIMRIKPNSNLIGKRIKEYILDSDLIIEGIIHDNNRGFTDLNVDQTLIESFDEISIGYLKADIDELIQFLDQRVSDYELEILY